MTSFAFDIIKSILDLILQLSLRDVGVKFLFQYVLVQMFSVDLATVLAM